MTRPAEVPDEHGGERDRQRDRGQEGVLDVLDEAGPEPRDREDRDLDPEVQDQQDTEQEAGQREPDQEEHPGTLIEDPSAV